MEKTPKIILDNILEALDGKVGAMYKGENGTALLSLDMGILQGTMVKQDEKIEVLEHNAENLAIDKQAGAVESVEIFEEFVAQLDAIVRSPNWETELAVAIKETSRKFDERV